MDEDHGNVRAWQRRLGVTGSVCLLATCVAGWPGSDAMAQECRGATFAEQAVAVGRRPNAVAHADFDENGTVDLAVASGTTEDVQILLGNGHGDFVLTANLEVTDQAQGVTAADFNGDDHTDLAVITPFDGLAVFLGDGGGGFGPPTTVSGGGAHIT